MISIIIPSTMYHYISLQLSIHKYNYCVVNVTVSNDTQVDHICNTHLSVHCIVQYIYNQYMYICVQNIYKKLCRVHCVFDVKRLSIIVNCTTMTFYILYTFHFHVSMKIYGISLSYHELLCLLLNT